MSHYWITDGAEVAIVNRDRNRVEFRTVDRITATQIVLDNGARYRLTNLSPLGDPNGRKLEQPTSRTVVDAVARQALAEFAHAAHEATRGPTRADDILAKLDQLASQLSDARNAITRLG